MLYLYLRKRDNSEIKIISTINHSDTITPKRIDDVETLGIKEAASIKGFIDTHKAEWDVWIESADNYTHLKANLKKRGINAPSSPNAPLHKVALTEELPMATMSKLKKGNSMIRRMN